MTIKQADIDANAQTLRELGMPDFLNVWLTLTPEKHTLLEAACARTRNRIKSGTPIRAPGGRTRSTISTGHARLTDPESIALKKEIDKQAKAAKRFRLAALREIRKPKMPTMTKANAAEAATEESTVSKKHPKKASKKAADESARTAVKGKTTKAAKPESKLDMIVQMLKRPEGCTTKDVLAATGWPAVSMPQQAKAAGLKLKKEKDGTVTRYRAA